MTPIADQPPPAPSDRPAVWPLVIQDVNQYGSPLPMSQEVVALVLADMAARDQLGRQRYGVPLQAYNGRDALIDLYQEGLDAVAYSRQLVEEGTVAEARSLYNTALDLTFRVRETIQRRDRP